MVGGNPQDIALAGTTQDCLQLTEAV